MAAEGAIEVLVSMLDSPHPHLQRQSSKALANLGVNMNNKDLICKAGGVPPLVKLAGCRSTSISIEAVAALANLAVNGELQTMHSSLPTCNSISTAKYYKATFVLMPRALFPLQFPAQI